MAQQTGACHKEAVLTLTLLQANATEPTSFSQLHRAAKQDIALRVVWEGLQRRVWTERHLMRLDQLLAEVDFFAAYELSVHGELTLDILPTLELVGKEEGLAFLSGLALFSEHAAGSLNFFEVPQGIRRLYEMPVVRRHHRRLAILDSGARVFKPSVANDIKAEVYQMRESVHPAPEEPVIDTSQSTRLHAAIMCGYNLWGTLLQSPWIDKEALRFAHAQSDADLCRVAIALERHRLQHGQFPESLDALDPEVRPVGGIPHDVIGGEPLRYRRTDDGRFQLYSVGWNQTDDGGTPGWHEREGYDGDLERWPDRSKGDWVWPQPER